MKRSAALPALFCACVAQPVFTEPVLAQTVQDGFYTNGYAELGHFSTSGNGETYGYTETTLGFSDAGSGFGVEFGVDALITDTDDESAIYGALTYQSSIGKLSFGVPRSALDAYLQNVPTPGGLIILKLGQTGSVKRSFVTTSYLLGDDEVPVGLRYDGTFGATNVGASYQKFDDLDVYDLAANYRIGETLLTGALEHVSSGSQSETRYFLGVESKFGKVTAGMLYSGNVAFNNETALHAYAKYKPLDELELTATALSIDSGSGSDTLYGVSADYSFNQGLYVQAGVVDDLGSSSTDTFYNLTLGLRF